MVTSVLMPLLQSVILSILESTGVFAVTSGSYGLGGGPLGFILYFISQILFVAILVIVNIIKFIFKTED